MHGGMKSRHNEMKSLACKGEFCEMHGGSNAHSRFYNKEKGI